MNCSISPAIASSRRIVSALASGSCSRLATPLHGRGELGEQQTPDGGILVADVSSLQVAVRLLERIEEAGWSDLIDPLGNPLEADEEVVFDPDSLQFGQRARHQAAHQRG